MIISRHACRVSTSAYSFELLTNRGLSANIIQRPKARQLWTQAWESRVPHSYPRRDIRALSPTYQACHYSDTREETSNGSQEAEGTPIEEEPGNPNLENTTSNEQHEDRYADSFQSGDAESIARAARQAYGDQLPEGLLPDEAYTVYERLYGRPKLVDRFEEVKPQELQGDVDRVALLQGEDGSLEEVEYQDNAEEVESAEDEIAEETLEASEEGETAIDADEEEAGNHSQDYVSSDEVDMEEDDLSGEELRAHPFTIAGRAGTSPSTIQLPRSSLVIPTVALLENVSNKHIREVAEKIFGGPGLPYSTNNPSLPRQMFQRPIPLDVYQSKMAPMEADTFFAVLAPGLYASTMSILVELRRRLGSTWLTKLMEKEGGPSVLDAGAGGSAAIAWRELLKAEWARINADAPEQQDRAPLGKTTVLARSPTLQARSAVFLEDTTFLPRLPDYIHVQQQDNSQRKQFDVIIASHGLWPLSEDWMRKQYVENLWKMLNPDGGVLIILEKGVSRGFEVVAGARKMILDNNFFESTRSGSRSFDKGETSSSGAIIAPCTTHARCPLYMFEGVSHQRKDYCHFRQRYIRPAYLQNILGSKDRNHEDVPFSYVAIQRGVSAEHLRRSGAGSTDMTKRKAVIGEEAADRAFEGYDIADPDLRPTGHADGVETPVTARVEDQEEQSSETGTALITPQPAAYPPPSPLSLPRIIFPPLKRHGHVLLDVCTPAGKFERWTVPRSYGKQAYRDARKASWGDLWPLGAKLRVPRKIRHGHGDIEPGGKSRAKTAKGRRGENDYADDGLRSSRPSKKAKLKEKRRRRARIAQE